MDARRASLLTTLPLAAACALGTCALATLAARPLASQGQAVATERPWMDARRPVGERAQLLLARMTLE